MFKYLLSTHCGIIPHIVEKREFLNHDLCIYMDDFYYKGSYYYDKGLLPLNTFLNTKQNLVIYRINKKVLNTRRGLLRITEEEYKQFIATTKPTDHNNQNIEDPKSLDEFINLLKDSKIPTTFFIKDLVDNGLLLHYQKDFFISDRKECDDFCCINYCQGYVDHLWKEKEISGKTIIALHNYFQIDKFVRALNEDKTILDCVNIILGNKD